MRGYARLKVVMDRLLLLPLWPRGNPGEAAIMAYEVKVKKPEIFWKGLIPHLPCTLDS